MMTTYREFETELRRLRRKAGAMPATQRGVDRRAASSAVDAPKATTEKVLRVVRPGNPQEYLDGAMVGWGWLR